jgi:hypothetical protein
LRSGRRQRLVQAAVHREEWVMKKRLGEILMERGLIDSDQLNAALGHQRQWGMRLGTALVAKGFVAEGMLTRVLSESLGFPMVDLSRVVIDPKVIALVPRRTCEAHDVIPVGVKEEPGRRKVLFLAMADPLNATVIDEIAFTNDCIVKPAIAQISSLEQAVRRYYLGQRVDIAPLSFEARPKTSAAFVDDSETMTITGTGVGGERVVVGRQPIDTAPVIELREEVPAEPVLSPFDAPPLPQDYVGQRTGVFAMPPPVQVEGVHSRVDELPIQDGDILAISRTADLEQIEALERKFWALMRVLARRGLVTKEEFLAELRNAE